MHRLRWWFAFWISLAALVGLTVSGLSSTLWEVDTTRLGPTIIGLYLVFTCYIGRLTVLAAENKALKRHLKACDLMVKSMVILGIIGTTVGLLIMLNAAFGGAMDPTVVLQGLKHGLSTLGITTLIGLVCYLALEIQVVNLEYAIEAR